MSENTLEFRRKTHAVKVAWGGRVVTIGGMNPIVVQSMTNTSTADVESSVAQVLALARAGSELVRLTVNTPDAARGVARIREALDRSGCDVPLVGDFHYNGHKPRRSSRMRRRALQVPYQSRQRRQGREGHGELRLHD